MCWWIWILLIFSVVVSILLKTQPEFVRDCLKDIIDIEDDWCDSDNPDSCTCNPIPLTRRSCCSVNPIIDSQVRDLQGGIWTKIKNFGCDEGLCIPNLGSRYVGASIVSTRNTVPYQHPQGSPSSQASNKPELIIEESPVTVGKNWHFTGVGSVVIKLFQPSQISGFSVSHPKTCSIPSGFERAAPKNFYVLGMNDLDEKEPFEFGNFTYNIGRKSTQMFPVKSCSEKHFSLIEFVFTNNHGHPDYTAVYKVKIYGVMMESPSK